MTQHNTYTIPLLPLPYELESRIVLKATNEANRALAELKGLALRIPNEYILINTLTLQEAQASSAIENIITTQDKLYRAELGTHKEQIDAATKEVLNYREAIREGFDSIQKTNTLSLNTIKRLQQVLIGNEAGFRKVPGTILQATDGTTVYTPPQDPIQIGQYMDNLELFINDDTHCDYDPLIKMAIIHHQFESIHPFYDGNGRTGRMVCILYLVKEGLLDAPILYLSRYITNHKTNYYRLLQTIHNTPNSDTWEQWILFILQGIAQTAKETITLVQEIMALMTRYQTTLQTILKKAYRTELLDTLFYHPYTKIEFVEKIMNIDRRTAAKYLNLIVDTGLLEKVKSRNTNFYINTALVKLFTTKGT